MPRLVPVIEFESVLVTDPPVRRARVGVSAGLIAAVMEMFPVFVPLSAPMRSVEADMRFSSWGLSERLPTTSVPRAIPLLVVLGASVTAPLGAEIFMFAVSLRVMLSAWSSTLLLFEVMEAELTKVPAR